MSEQYAPSPKLRQLLRGVPEPTIRACAEFQATGNQAAFDRAVSGVIEHHLTTPSPQPVASLPGTTALVADLQLDSLTMAEMAFLFDDIFGTKLPHEGLLKVVTLDDLRALLHAEIAKRPA